MIVYICICTYKRPRLISKTLNSISNLKLSKNLTVKVVIIDNETRSSINNIIKKYNNKKKIRIIRRIEKKKGIVFARNRFLNFIKKEKKNVDYLAFIDDDCEVHPLWLLKHTEILKQTKANISTGPQIGKNLTKKNKNYYLLSNKHIDKKTKFTNWAATNNVFFEKKILNNSNLLFDKTLNKIGGSDQLFFLKLNKIGYKIIWFEEAKVYENLSEKKIDKNWFYKRNLRYGYSGAYMNYNINGFIFGNIITILTLLFYMIKAICLSFLIYNKINLLKIKLYYYRSIGIIRFLLGNKITKYN